MAILLLLLFAKLHHRLHGFLLLSKQVLTTLLHYLFVSSLYRMQM